MAQVTKTFTMNLPDEYLASTAEDGLTGEWTYTGPDKMFVMVDPETGAFLPGQGWCQNDDDRTDEENLAAAQTWAGVGKKAVLITAENDPILIAAMYGQAPLASELPQTTYTLPGESEPFYSRPTVQYPDHVYEIGDIMYDLATESWVTPFPWKKPHITREEFLRAHTAILAQEKTEDTDNFTSAQLTAWNAYLTEFENVPTKFADYLDTPWMVPFPINPMFGEDWSELGNAVGLSTVAVGAPPAITPPVEIVGAGTTLEQWTRGGVAVEKTAIEVPDVEATAEPEAE